MRWLLPPELVDSGLGLRTDLYRGAGAAWVVLFALYYFSEHRMPVKAVHSIS